MPLMGVAMLVRYDPNPLKAAEGHAVMSGDWKLEINVRDNKHLIVVGGTFVGRAPGEHPMWFFHNDPSFLGIDSSGKGFEQACHDLGKFGYVDERSKLPGGWKFKEHIQHPIFPYFVLTHPCNFDMYAVTMEEVLANHYYKNGCHK